MAKNDNLGDFLTDIANAIRTKKESSGTINAQDFSSEILSIPSGGGDSSQQLYDIDVTLVAPSQNIGGMNVDLYIGSADLTNLYNVCVSSDYESGHVFIINDVAVKYFGDISVSMELPIPVFQFGNFSERTLSAESFLIADITPMGMGLGITLLKVAGRPVVNNKIVIKKGFEFLSFPIIFPENLKYISDAAFYEWEEYNQPLVIPNSVTSIGDSAFYGWQSNNQPLVIPSSVTSIGEWAFAYWQSNNQPLVIPNSVTSIGNNAFYYWEANNQPLVIPNSVTSIGEWAFGGWEANNQPLVIPNSVTSIGEYAFYDWSANNQPLVIPNSVTSIGGGAFTSWSNVPYVEMKSETPPVLTDVGAFSGQNNAPIYVPDESVTAYKTATNWVSLADRIFPISDK